MQLIDIKEIEPYVRFAKLYLHTPTLDNNLRGWAPDWRLFCIREGKCWLYIKDRKFFITKNSLIIIPPKTEYIFTRHNDSNTILCYLLNFDLTQNHKNRPPLNPIMEETKSLPPYDNVTIDKFSPYFIKQVDNSLFEKLMNIITSKAIESTEIDEIKTSLFTKLCLLDIYQKNTISQTSHDHISNIISYIVSNISKPFSIKKMAEDLFFHPFYISKLFKDATKLSLHDFIMQERISHAKNILNSNLSISIEDVAYQSGFTNVSHFCKTFLKLCGTTPNKFRKNETP